jgi:hypothetical protein
MRQISLAKFHGIMAKHRFRNTMTTALRLVLCYGWTQTEAAMKVRVRRQAVNNALLSIAADVAQLDRKPPTPEPAAESPTTLERPNRAFAHLYE